MTITAHLTTNCSVAETHTAPLSLLHPLPLDFPHLHTLATTLVQMEIQLKLCQVPCRAHSFDIVWRNDLDSSKSGKEGFRLFPSTDFSLSTCALFFSFFPYLKEFSSSPLPTLLTGIPQNLSMSTSCSAFCTYSSLPEMSTALLSHCILMFVSSLHLLATVLFPKRTTRLKDKEKDWHNLPHCLWMCFVQFRQWVRVNRGNSKMVGKKKKKKGVCIFPINSFASIFSAECEP